MSYIEHYEADKRWLLRWIGRATLFTIRWTLMIVGAYALLILAIGAIR